jgi:hypothetical protein
VAKQDGAAPLSGTDPQPLRHQVWELPEFKPSSYTSGAQVRGGRLSHAVRGGTVHALGLVALHLGDFDPALSRKLHNGQSLTAVAYRASRGFWKARERIAASQRRRPLDLRFLAEKRKFRASFKPES